MKHNEGNELAEYALIAVVVSLGVTLALNGAGPRIVSLLNVIASYLLG